MVPASYSGPRLPESGITLQFVLDLMETFQGQVRGTGATCAGGPLRGLTRCRLPQGKLHTKYCLQILKQLKQYLRQQPSLVKVGPVVARATASGTDPHVRAIVSRARRSRFPRPRSRASAWSSTCAATRTASSTTC